MADVYTLEVIDRASPAARQVEVALRNVARAALVADRAFRSQDKSQIKMAGAFEKVARAELRSARALKLLAAQGMPVKKLDRGLGTLGVTMGSLLARGAELGIRAMVGFGASVFDTIDHVGRSEMALRGMLGSQEAADAEIAKGTELAKKYGLGVGETIDQLRQFAAFGFGSKQREGLLQMAGDMRALGFTSENTGRVMAQLSKVQTQGKLQGDELLILAENGINVAKVYERLEKRLGKTREQILQLQKAGQLKSGDALNAIAESVVLTAGSTKLGEAGLKAANETVGGLTGQISANIEAAFRASIKKAEPQIVRAMQDLKIAMNGVDWASIFTTLTSGLAKFAELLTFVAGNLDFFKNTIMGVGIAATGVGAAFVFMGGAATAAWIAAALPVVAVVAAIAGIGLAIGQLVTYWDQFKEGSVLIATDLQNWLRGLALSMLESAFPVGTMIVRGIIDGIANGASSLFASVANLGSEMLTKLKFGLSIHSPSRKMRNEVGVEIPAGVAQGVEADEQLAFSAAREMSEGTVYAAENGLRALSPARLDATGERAGSISSSSESLSMAPTVNAYLTVEGSDPSAVVPQLRAFFENEIAAMFEMHLEGSGA